LLIPIIDPNSITINKRLEIVDDLSSTNKDVALSAKQGKVLNDAISSVSSGGSGGASSKEDNLFRGMYLDDSKLKSAITSDIDGSYAIVLSTDTIWRYDSTTNQWINTHNKSIGSRGYDGADGPNGPKGIDGTAGTTPTITNSVIEERLAQTTQELDSKPTISANLGKETNDIVNTINDHHLVKDAPDKAQYTTDGKQWIKLPNVILDLTRPKIQNGTLPIFSSYFAGIGYHESTKCIHAFFANGMQPALIRQYARSLDGIAWETKPLPNFTVSPHPHYPNGNETGIHAVCYDSLNKRILAAPFMSSDLLVCNDGATYNRISTNLLNINNHQEMVYVPQHKRCYILDQTGNVDVNVSYSTNDQLTSFVNYNNNDPTNYQRTICYNEVRDELMVICFTANMLYISKDKGVNWIKYEDVLPPEFRYAHKAIALNNGSYMTTFGEKNGVGISEDGITWRQIKYADPIVDNNTYLMYNKFLNVIALSADNGLYVSRDNGNSWKKVASGYFYKTISMEDRYGFCCLGWGNRNTVVVTFE
jgi:hypothetical protein